jgi:2-methylisocitrate lyase-like PEP mutase family enzyme
MTAERHTRRLRRLIGGPKIVPAPGVYDALTARLAEQAGFPAVFLAGSALAYTQLARPDVGLVTATEVAQVLARIRERSDIPILVDGDSGFGNAANLQRTVRLFERAGASGVQIEDQAPLKRADALTERALAPVEEMVGKIKAAQDARDDADFVISARTDAVFTAGVDEALRRAAAYAQAGADMIFVEGLASVDDMRRLAGVLAGGPPRLHNVLGAKPGLPASLAALQGEGYAMALFPGVVVQSVALAARRALERLSEGEWSGLFDEIGFTPADLNAAIEAGEFLDGVAAYAPPRRD